MIFSETDIKHFNSLGISEGEVVRQFKLLTGKPHYPFILSCASLGNGIVSVSDTEQIRFVELYRTLHKKYDCGRFIPASGAATRMFSFLSTWMDSIEHSNEVELFFDQFHNFAFSKYIDEKDRMTLLRRLLFEDLEFASLPKALIPFHKVNEKTYTAFDSHLAESAQYAFGKNGEILTHFSISEEHQPIFSEKSAKACLEADGKKHQISFSFQERKTDTIALDEKNEILRDDDGRIIFRPGGHGALLNNLQKLDYDVIFIRNIDNVVSVTSNQEYVRIHESMGGMMLELMEFIFRLQKNLDENLEITKDELNYLQTKWQYSGKNDSSSIREFVNRPIRICGMVKNEGEPGGGPFFIEEENGISSLQIIESAQIDKANPLQVNRFNSATHFNPVDICCCIKNYKGDKYVLEKFSKPDFSFVSEKNMNGKKCKVLEHPGLWNGSMHNWLTLFIEIPSTIFNPVKTVNDLLRPNHQK